MKTIKWNIGIIVIRFGYFVRKYQWETGKSIIRFGYKLRGDIPMKTWKGNHV